MLDDKKSYRNTESFGKRIEYYIIGEMLKEGLDCYIPLVDDHGVDCIVKKNDGTFLEVQIKARSNDVKEGNEGLFSAIKHDKVIPNYYFVFYSEAMRENKWWIMSSEEFMKECAINKKEGDNKGKCSITFTGVRKDKETGKSVVYCKEKFEKYYEKDFSRFK